MAPTSWSYPANVTSTTVNGITTETPVNPTDTFSLATSTVVTAPPNSSLVATFPAQSASVANIQQNTLGYDAEFVGYLASTAASVTTIAIGVGATSSPSMTNVTTNFTSAVSHLLSLPAVVPSGYYYSIKIVQANGAAVGGTVTVLANPL